MQTYARHGGTSSLFINDDGLRILPPDQAKERIEYYATHGIGWVARPKHGHQGQSTFLSICSPSNPTQASYVRVALRRLPI